MNLRWFASPKRAAFAHSRTCTALYTRAHIHSIRLSRPSYIQCPHSPIFRHRSLSTAFTSQYYCLENAKQEIPAFLLRKSLQFRESDTHYIIRECPFCHDTYGKADNQHKLYVDKQKGVYKCHRCGSAGSWLDLKRHVQSSDSHGSVNSYPNTAANPINGHHSASERLIQALDTKKAIEIQHNLTKDDHFQSVLQYLVERRQLQVKVLEKYGVGAVEHSFYCENEQQNRAFACISFPWMANASDVQSMGFAMTPNTPSSAKKRDENVYNVVRLKLRAMEDKCKQRLVPKGGSWGLFGYHTIPSDAQEIVLTEGEFDAMTVNQATNIPAISLPNGCQSLPPSVLPLLERFSKIYLWMDHDAQGQMNVSKFAKKLGLSRCYIVHMPNTGSKVIKDANDAYIAGMDLTKIIQGAQRIPHAQIATFEHLRQQVLDEILNPIRYNGIQSRSMPSLNRVLKGHRMGEITILTGPTGCGKTTLLSQLSLDLCGQGVSTLWGSFEIQNTRLIRKMLTQLAGKSLDGNLALFERVGDLFEALPMHFLRFFGSTDVEELLDAMEYAVYAHDVQHILLDNVQFMMTGQGRGFDKFERQDAALDKFRRFATQKNVHITLVIHPRKEQEDQDLNVASVFGTAKATQEADNVMILQRTRGNCRLDIRKNRFDGTLGSIPLVFDPESNRLNEVTHHIMEEENAVIDIESQTILEQKCRQVSMQRKKQEHTEIGAQGSVVISRETSPISRPQNGRVNGFHNGFSEPFATFTPIIPG